MSEETKNELLLAHFAINCELNKVQVSVNAIRVTQEKLSRLLYPKHPEIGNGHASDTSTHD